MNLNFWIWILHQDNRFFIVYNFQVLYCDQCRESCHPLRGPLATHNLGPPRATWQSHGKGTRPIGADGTAICGDHNGEAVSLYCALCKNAACSNCLRDRHAAHPHDVLPLAAACKAQKVSDILRKYWPIFKIFFKGRFRLWRYLKICGKFMRKNGPVSAKRQVFA